MSAKSGARNERGHGWLGLRLVAIGLAGVLLMTACGGPDQPVSSSDTSNDAGNSASAAGSPSGVRGIVTDESGAPLEGVGIAVTAGPGPIPEILRLTDANGEYMWPLKQGKYTLAAYMDGYEPLSQEVTVKQDEIAQLDFQLTTSP
jgi:Carboxypeptidase regulatory-like domain